MTKKIRIYRRRWWLKGHHNISLLHVTGCQIVRALPPLESYSDHCVGMKQMQWLLLNLNPQICAYFKQYNDMARTFHGALPLQPHPKLCTWTVTMVGNFCPQSLWQAFPNPHIVAMLLSITLCQQSQANVHLQRRGTVIQTEISRWSSETLTELYTGWHWNTCT